RADSTEPVPVRTARCASRLQAAMSSALGTCGNAALEDMKMNAAAKNVAAWPRMAKVMPVPPSEPGGPTILGQAVRGLARGSCAAYDELRDLAGPCAWLAGLARRRGDGLQRLMRLSRPQVRAANDVRHRHDAQQLVLLIDDGDAPDLILAHQLGGL